MIWMPCYILLRIKSYFHVRVKFVFMNINHYKINIC